MVIYQVMDQSIKVLQELLRLALWGDEPRDLKDLELSPRQWTLTMNASLKQGVQGLVLDSLERVGEPHPPRISLDQFRAMADAQKLVYRQHLKLTDYLRVRFENSDRPFTPIVLKGLSLARLYEKPWLRNLGDIDLYFASPECEKWATDCVESWGTPVGRGKCSESSYVMGGVVVEHHGLLVHPHTIIRSQSRKLQEWIENEMKSPDSTRSISLEGVEIRVLRPDLDLLQLLSHALKHCINEGIGLRQLCDIAMYLHANKDIIDGGKTLEVLRLFGLERWARLVFAFLVQWLGLAEGDLPYKVRNVQKQNIATLLDEVAKSGDLGFMDERVNGRPKGWKGKAFTARRIFTKAWRFLPYAPREIIAWLPTL